MYTSSYGASTQRAYAPSPQPYDGGRLQYQVPTYDTSAPLKPQGGRKIRMPLSEKLLVYGGLITLALLIAFPVSDAALLLDSFNYMFWSREALPIVTIVALVMILPLFYAMAAGQGAESWTVRGLSTLATTFCTLFGVILVLASLFLYYRQEYVVDALTYNCKGSVVTQSVRQSYVSLLALRESPLCAKLWSIEDCGGYADAAPAAHAAYFKALESNFHCSGFCAEAPPAIAGNASMLQVYDASAAAFLGKGTDSQQQLVGKKALERMHRANQLPPALFSQSSYKTSCDGAAARDLRYMAIGTSKVWWWMAVVTISLSSLVGLMEFLTGQK